MIYAGPPPAPQLPRRSTRQNLRLFADFGRCPRRPGAAPPVRARMAASLTPCLHGAAVLLRQPQLHGPALGLAWPAAAAANRVVYAAAAAASSAGLPADCRLAAELFHCPADGAALRPSQRRSAPAGWLDGPPLAAVLSTTAQPAAAAAAAGGCPLAWAGVRTNQ